MKYLTGFRTKSMKAINDGDRVFEGVSTVEMVDVDGEITSRDMMLKQFEKWMERGAPISDRHSNRIVGKGIKFDPIEVEDSESRKKFYGIKITGKIYDNHQLDNKVWNAIKSGQYRGLSYGGANLADREPIKQADGTLAYKLNDIELYEVSVCPEPAAPLALITSFNKLAKTMTAEELAGMDVVERDDGKVTVKCDKLRCYVVNKAENEDSDTFKYPLAVAKSKMKKKVNKAEEEEEEISVEDDEEEESEDSSEKSLEKLTGLVTKLAEQTMKSNKKIQKQFDALEEKLEKATEMAAPAQGAKVKLPNDYVDGGPGHEQGSEKPAKADAEGEDDDVDMEKKSLEGIEDIDDVSKWWDDLAPTKRKFLAPKGKYKELTDLTKSEMQNVFTAYDEIMKDDEGGYEEEYEPMQKEYTEARRPNYMGNPGLGDVYDHGRFMGNNEILKTARMGTQEDLGHLANRIKAGEFGNAGMGSGSIFGEGYPEI